MKAQYQGQGQKVGVHLMFLLCFLYLLER
jgi:hypothetical protein